MAKLSPAELKAQGADLNALMSAARKRPHNCALLIAKEGIVLEAHPIKGADIMRRQAKANGGGPKGLQGVLNANGKVLEFTAEDEDFPRNLGKLTKKYFSERGLTVKVILISPNGERVEDEDEDDLDRAAAPVRGSDETDQKSAETRQADTRQEDDTPDDDADDLNDNADGDDDKRRELLARLGKIVPALKSLLRVPSPSGAKLAKAALAAGKQISTGNYKIAASMVGVLERAMKSMDDRKSNQKTQAVKSKLLSEFNALKPRITTAVKGDPKGMGRTSLQGAQRFATALKDDDFKTAGAELASLVKTLRSLPADGKALDPTPKGDKPGPTTKDIATGIVAREGGFVNDPDDKGGATKYGVTIGKMQDMKMDLNGDGEVTVEDVKLLSKEQAAEIFLKEYFVKPGIDKLPAAVQAPVFDMMVNAGNNAVKILQRMLKVKGHDISVSGKLDPETIAAAKVAYQMDEIGLVDDYGRARRDFYYAIADANPSQRKYARRKDGGKGGWIMRAEEFMTSGAELTDAEHRQRVSKWGDENPAIVKKP